MPFLKAKDLIEGDMKNTDTPTSNDVDQYLNACFRNYPGFVEKFVQQYEEEYGIGLRARVKAAIALTLSLYTPADANDGNRPITAYLLAVLRLIDDDPEGTAKLGQRIGPEIDHILELKQLSLEKQKGDHR
jgi:hypothetical protein